MKSTKSRKRIKRESWRPSGVCVCRSIGLKPLKRNAIDYEEEMRTCASAITFTFHFFLSSFHQRPLLLLLLLTGG